MFVAGDKSTIRTTAGVIRLIVKAFNLNSDPFNAITIYKLNSKGNKRFFVSAVNYNATNWLTPYSTISNNQLNFSGSRYGKSSYQIDMFLPAGEFGLVMSNPYEDKLIMSCIGVDECTNQHQYRYKSMSHDITKDLTFNVNGVDFRMSYIESGNFPMGTSVDDSFNVSLDSFFLGETEVTQKLWDAVMPEMSHKSRNDKGGDYPVENVSWNDCQIFIDRISKLTGKHFSLPTEAEWFYVASEGQGVNYKGNDIMWNLNTSKSSQIVATLPPNKFNVYDILGNVWEWCEDGYQQKYDNAITQNPFVKEGARRIIRGGSWETPPAGCTVIRRSAYGPDFTDYRVGFRLAIRLNE